MATYTPINHWMALPVREVRAWCARVARIQKEDAAPSSNDGSR